MPVGAHKNHAHDDNDDDNDDCCKELSISGYSIVLARFLQIKSNLARAASIKCRESAKKSSTVFLLLFFFAAIFRLILSRARIQHEQLQLILNNAEKARIKWKSQTKFRLVSIIKKK